MFGNQLDNTGHAVLFSFTRNNHFIKVFHLVTVWTTLVALHGSESLKNNLFISCSRICWITLGFESLKTIGL